MVAVPYKTIREKKEGGNGGGTEKDTGLHHPHG